MLQVTHLKTRHRSLQRITILSRSDLGSIPKLCWISNILFQLRTRHYGIISRTKTIVAGSFGWAQSARLRQSLVQISDIDGALICQVLKRQEADKRVYELDAADRRHITQRTVVRTETGEVEVEVPGREEMESEPGPPP